MPCSAMTRVGRKRSKRCKEKKAARRAQAASTIQRLFRNAKERQAALRRDYDSPGYKTDGTYNDGAIRMLYIRPRRLPFTWATHPGLG